MAKNFMFVCPSCGEEIVTDNEDDFIAQNCPFCVFDDDWESGGFEYMVNVDYRICNCEDWPCCGH